MDRTLVAALASAWIAGGAMWAWSSRAEARSGPPAHDLDTPESSEPILAVPPPPALPAEKVALGRRLFSERALSADGTVACIDCHDVARGGADSKARSAGVRGRAGALNAPTIWDADANAKQYWDGRAETLEDQIDVALLDPDEMGNMWSAIVEKLRADPAYVSAFGKGGISPTTVKDAIAAYERTLVTTGSRFDRWLGGDPSALTTQERDGYAAFKRYGCTSCHQGRNVGGNMFETIGVMGDYFADRGTPITQADLGRFNVTKRAEDRHRFRVPSLRRVGRTAPYFHDGQIPTLEAAIVAMGKYQLGIQLPPGDVDDIGAFLRSLGPDS